MAGTVEGEIQLVLISEVVEEIAAEAIWVVVEETMKWILDHMRVDIVLVGEDMEAEVGAMAQVLMVAVAEVMEVIQEAITVRGLVDPVVVEIIAVAEIKDKAFINAEKHMMCSRCTQSHIDIK